MMPALEKGLLGILSDCCKNVTVAFTNAAHISAHSFVTKAIPC